MNSTSKKFIFLTEAVVYIALSGDRPVRSDEICRAQSLPQRYLESLMQGLVRAGVLRSVRGPRGGYMLGMERRRIRLSEILKVLRREEDAERLKISPFAQEVILPLVQNAQDQMMLELGSTSVEDLCRLARERGFLGEEIKKPDFAI